MKAAAILEQVPVTYLIAGGAVLAAWLWVSSKGAEGAGEAIGKGAVDLATGLVRGTTGAAAEVVQGAGEAIGVPRTNMTECEKAKAEGRTWDASFACPAGDFIKYLWD